MPNWAGIAAVAGGRRTAAAYHLETHVSGMPGAGGFGYRQPSQYQQPHLNQRQFGQYQEGQEMWRQAEPWQQRQPRYRQRQQGGVFTRLFKRTPSSSQSLPPPAGSHGQQQRTDYERYKEYRRQYGAWAGEVGGKDVGLVLRPAHASGARRV